MSKKNYFKTVKGRKVIGNDLWKVKKLVQVLISAGRATTLYNILSESMKIHI